MATREENINSYIEIFEKQVSNLVATLLEDDDADLVNLMTNKASEGIVGRISGLLSDEELDNIITYAKSKTAQKMMVLQPTITQIVSEELANLESSDLMKTFMEA